MSAVSVKLAGIGVRPPTTLRPRRLSLQALRHPRAARLLAAAVLAAGALLVARPALAANPTLDVTFAVNGTISVTLADGTPVGTASGAPTVIPAGYYTLFLTGPGGCAALPYFVLQGPDEDVVGNISEGTVTDIIYNAYFAPNATYTWRDGDANPPVLYTFTTSSAVEGADTAPPETTTNVGGVSGVTANVDAVGSGHAGTASMPFRGTLSATVTAGGPRLSFDGRSVSSLAAGRYTVQINDHSATAGFVLGSPGRPALSLAARAFVGTRSTSINLTAGQWFFAAGGLTKKTYFIVLG